MRKLYDELLTPAELDRALCRHIGDPDLFFERETRGDWRTRREAVRAAKAVCAACPVRRRCLEVALINDEPFGVFGGLTVTERRRLARQEVA